MINTNQITLEEYEKQLKQHDWYYMMSEDSDKYKQGCYNNSRLLELAINKELKDLFNLYRNKYKIN